MESCVSTQHQAVHYENCPVCKACVVETRLTCAACIKVGNFTDQSGKVTFADLQLSFSQLQQSHRDLQSCIDSTSKPPSEASCDAVQRSCELRYRVAQLRKALAATREAAILQRSLRQAARTAAQERRRDIEMNRRKCDELSAYNRQLKAKIHAVNANNKYAEVACRKGIICKGIATEVYNLKESDRSLVNSRLKLPPLNSFASRSLEPAPEVYAALLSASCLLQALTACLAVWTPFQPLPTTFIRSPLSRDSVSAQHRKLEVTLHSLCCQYAVSELFESGDPLLTLSRLLNSSRIGWDFIPCEPKQQQRLQQQRAASVKRASLPSERQRQLRLAAEAAASTTISYDPHHVRSEWDYFPDDVGGGADDWVDLQEENFPIQSESCYESRAFFVSFWR